VSEHDISPAPAPAPSQGVSRFAVIAALIIGAIIGGMAVEYWLVKQGIESPAAQVTGAAAGDLERLVQIAPTQSHTMKDVGDHWANLWFAVQAENWPLATFYFTQARQSVRWTVAVRPERVMPDGSTVNVQGLFEAIDPSAFAFVGLALEDQDKEMVESAYREALTACQSCHEAVGMPFLRPTVPTAPADTILGFEPEPSDQ
jgi:cytochrome c553